jgi:RHS repeat-associated protein
MKRTAYALLLTCYLLILAGIASPQVATGTPKFNSFGGGPFDAVNLGNLNVHFAIPIIQKSGRGLPFSYPLTYDNSIWTPVSVNGNLTWSHSGTWGWQSATPQNSTPYVQYSMTTGPTYQCGGYPPTGASYYIVTYNNFVYHDQFGGMHPFGLSASYLVLNGPPTNCPPPGPTPPSSQTGNALDGSNYTITIGVATQSGISGSLVNCNGQTITAPWLTAPPTQASNYSAVDANGNKISFNASTGQFTDTLGQTVLTVTGSNPVTYTYTGQTSNAISWQLHYSTYNVKTNFNCSGIAQFSQNGVSLVSSLSLPDGTSYAFTYEATPGFSGYVTGRIKSVTLPTGGSITYTYTGGNNGIICSDGSTAGLTRAVSPGGTWTYARSQISGNHWQTTISTPPDSQNSGSASDQTVIDFEKDNGTGNGATYSFYETQRKAYQGNATGTPLLTTTTCWNGNTANCTTTNVTSPITQRNVTTQYNGGVQSETDTFINACGLVSKTDQYGYVATGTGPLLRKTNISYAALGNNIVNRPSSVNVTDGSGNLLSKTTYSYDEYSLNVLSGTPQHQSINGSRGNTTTVSNTVIGGTVLTEHFTYYDTGNVYQSTDVNGGVTTYYYWDPTSTCGNAFVRTIQPPASLGLAIGYTWDCIGGVATSTNDPNNNTTNFSYTDPSTSQGDLFWRIQTAIDPLNNTTTFAYQPNSTNPTPPMFATYMLFNGGHSVVSNIQYKDSWGRTYTTQQWEQPSGSLDTVSNTYDAFGRPYSKSMPCVTGYTLTCSTAQTTQTYDALNRVLKTTDGGVPTPGYVSYTYNQNDVLQAVGPAPPGENLKQKQLEYDALGRLSKVCELTNLLGYGVCSMQSTSPNGYLTTYVYSVNASGYPTTTVTQNAQAGSGQQTRVYTYDLLGRLVSEQNPENGTVTYTYDSDSAGNCTGTYNGDLVKRTDAKGNKICDQYDAIHRVTQITYPSGPDSANTPSKTFVYDSATFNGTAMLNPKGRLVEAYTGASGSKTTDEFFQYSVRGELTDTWQCTPHSGTNGCASVSNYYKVTAGFWENGALKTLSSSISGLPTENYAVDGMGRTNAVSATSGQSPIPANGVVYDLANFKTTITYGSTDSDVVTLDPFTGRMTQYKFNVGSQNVTGNMTWNANGSLGTLAITNQLNSLDTQTCSYSHDDLSRISSVGCLNGSTHRWDQQFTYDAFGNITKTVPVGGTGINFLPTYDTSKNWITALPGITTTTDANGQMTYDGAHNYTWDAEGKMHMLDTATLTYDALGRMVEKAVSSAYTQIVYGPQGRFATMNGQTLVSAFIPAPGAQVVYTSASLNTTNKIAYYRHADHLGSSRLATTPSRTLYSSTAYAPYGEPYSQSGTTDLSFTGQEQDTVSGIYDFPARNYPVNQGRWIAPDPAGLAATNPANPQSWNRYAYVLNNPMSNIDPSGLDCQELIGNNGAWVGGCDPSSPTGEYHGTNYGPGCWGGWCPGTYGPVWNEAAATGGQMYRGERSYSNCISSGGTLCGTSNDVPGVAGILMGVSASGVPMIFVPSGCVTTWGANGADKTCDSAAWISAGDFAEQAKDTLSEVAYYASLGWQWSSNPGDNAANALRTAMRKTGIQAMANPCTYVLWYGGSAAVGTFGEAVGGSEAVLDGAEDLGFWGYQKYINAQWKGVYPGFGVIAAGMSYAKLGWRGCNAIEGQ